MIRELKDIHEERTLQWTATAKLALGLSSSLLKKLLKAMDDNPSKDAPYHNNQHQMAVALRCMELMKLEIGYLGRYSGKPSLASLWISQIDPTMLFLAVSLHDWGHTQGAESDDYNVSLAVNRLKTLLIGEIKDEHRIEQAIDLINVTQYPFVKEPDSFMGYIIRDADLLMVLEEDRDYFLDGLATELKLDSVEFKKNNVAWLSEQRMYTYSGRALMKSFIQQHT